MDKNYFTRSQSTKQIVCLLISIGLILASSPARAITLKTGETKETTAITNNSLTSNTTKSISLDSILEAAASAGLDFLYGNLQALLAQIISDTLPAEADVAIDLGSLGLPDPDLLKTNLEDYLKNNSIEQLGALDELFGSKIGGSGSTELRSILDRNFLTSLAKETAKKGTLATQAQQISKQKLETSKQAVEENQTLAEDSETQDVTQNIERNISKQLAKQTQINDLVYQELQKSQTTQALNSEMTAEVVDEISGSNIKNIRQDIGDFQLTINHQSLFSMPGQKFDSEGGK
jgi:hypothetical protein